MEREDRVDSVNPQATKSLDDTGKTLPAPRFDENSIHRARPAVPLAYGRTSRALPLVALAVAAGLVGGLVAILTLALYERRAAPPDLTTTQTREQQTAPAQTNDARDAQTSNAQTNSEQASAAQTSPAHARANAPAPDAATRNDKSADGDSPATTPADTAKTTADGHNAPPEQPQRAASDAEARELRDALSEWIAATNARDIDRQMKFYEPRVAAYYLSRNASREAVRAEKEHVFARASAVDVRAGDPEITLSPDGQTAAMRFRKDYAISGDGLDKRGAVIQELRWRRTPHGWRITSERDLRVVP